MKKSTYVAPVLTVAGDFHDDTRAVAGLGFDWYLLARS
ncbi:lasso RiPP family leader peptide-containing protein [Glutamicibacter sp. NPDC087344]